MRSRNIKPDFFTDEKIIQLTYAERLFFIGLWCIADSEGFFEIKPHEMKLKLFPDQKVDIKKMLNSLQKVNVVKLNGQHGYLTNFIKHQRPHPREKKSIVSKEVKEQLVKLNGQPCNYPASPSDIMNDDIMNDERGKMNTDAGKDTGYLSLFSQLWKLYPIKKEKQKAIAEFKNAKIQNDKFDEITNALKLQIAHKDDCDKNGKFCPEFPYLHRWIKSKRWTDEIEKTNTCILDEEKHKKARAEYVEKRKREMESEGNNNHV